MSTKMAKTTAKKTLTRAEIQKAYRERKKAENEVACLQKERDRWRARCADHKVKTVADMTDREKRHVQKQWRDKQQKSRLKRKNEAALSPPDSDVAIIQRQRGRKKKRRTNSASYRMIVKLKYLLTIEKRVKDRYRKKFERLTKRKKLEQSISISDQTPQSSSLVITPRSKTKQMLKNSTVTSNVKKTRFPQ
jgi:hypothetical protein